MNSTVKLGSNSPVQNPVRPTRIPMGVPRRKMSTPTITGYQCRWMNDIPGRLDRAVAGGYEFVDRSEVSDYGLHEVVPGNSDQGSRVSRIVGVHRDELTPLRAYLMKIKKAWYDDDQAVKQKRVNETDAAIRRGALNGEPGQDGKYVKSINIR